MTTTLGVGGANGLYIVLPVMPASDRKGPEFLPPAKDPELPGYSIVAFEDESVSDFAETRSIERIPLLSKTRIVSSGASGKVHPGATIKYWEQMVHEAQDDDPARARERIASSMHPYYGAGFDVDRNCPFGPPEVCARAIQPYLDAGVTTLMLGLARPDVGELKRLHDEVLPLLV